MAKANKNKKKAAALTPAGEQALTDQLAGQVSADALDNTVLTEDPALAAEAARIRGSLEGDRGKILQLDDETLAQLASGQAHNEALLNRRFESESDSMMTRLFGSGRERSTHALDEGGRLLGDQGLVLSGSRAAHDSNVLNARLGVTGQNLQNLGMQGDMLTADRSAQHADRGLQFAQTDAQRSRRASMLDSIYGRRSNELNTRTQANAQIKSSRISAGASRYASDNSLKAAMEHAAASRYGSRVGAEASRYGADRSLDAARLGANASRANALLRSETDIYGIDSRERLGFADINQRGDQFSQDLAWQQDRFATEDERARDFFDRDLGFRNRELAAQQQIARDQARQQKRSSLLGGLGGLLGGIGTIALASDEELKEEIRMISNPLEKISRLRGVSWRWNDKAAHLHAGSGGVIAQELEPVLPDAVHKMPNGYKGVDYGYVIGLLVEAVNELQEKIDGI